MTDIQHRPSDDFDLSRAKHQIEFVVGVANRVVGLTLTLGGLALALNWRLRYGGFGPLARVLSRTLRGLRRARASGQRRDASPLARSVGASTVAARDSGDRVPVLHSPLHFPPHLTTPAPSRLPARSVVTLVLGVAMFAIGLYVALHPLWTHNSTITGTRWLDVAFALVFMLRGLVNFRVVRDRQRAARASSVA